MQMLNYQVDVDNCSVEGRCEGTQDHQKSNEKQRFRGIPERIQINGKREGKRMVEMKKCSINFYE